MQYYSIYLCLVVSLASAHKSCLPNESNFLSDNNFYCGVQADMIKECLKKENPEWPFLIRKCSELKNCTASQTPTMDPNSSNQARECIAKTGAVDSSKSSR